MQIHHKTSKMSFWVEPGYEEQILGSEAPNWTDLSGDRRAELVKANNFRKIWRVRLDKLDVFVKRYEFGGVPGLLKCLFRSSPAAVEFQNHRRVRAAGLMCPEPLAFAQKGFRGISRPSILITAAVIPAKPLNVYLGEHPLDDELVGLLADLLGRCHRAGLAHPDPHLGNFLVRVGSDGQRELILTDLQKLQKIRLSTECKNKPLGKSGRVNKPAEALTRSAKRNLACGYRTVSYHMSSRQREKFLVDYLAVLAPEYILTEAAVRETLSQVERMAWKDSLRRWAKRDLRSRRNSKYFARIRLAGHWRGSVLLTRKRLLPGSIASVSSFTAEQWRKTLADPLGLFAGPRVETVTDSRSSLVVRRRIRVGEIHLEVYCKLVRPRPKVTSQLKTLWGAFRASPPQRAYETGFALLNRRLPTVLPLAWLAKQVGPYRSLAVLITEAMPETVSLEQFLKAKCGQGEGFQNHCLLKDLAKMTAELAGSLIRHGFIHRDFQPRTILLQRSSDGRKRLFLSDCQTVRQVGWVTRRQRLRLPMRMQLATENLLGLSRTIRLRFLLVYLKTIRVPQSQWKWYWHKTGAWAKRNKTGRSSCLG